MAEAAMKKGSRCILCGQNVHFWLASRSLTLAEIKNAAEKGTQQNSWKRQKTCQDYTPSGITLGRPHGTSPGTLPQVNMWGDKGRFGLNTT